VTDIALLFPTLTVYRLRLLLALGEGRHTLPAYLGSTVRGVVAGFFRDMVCLMCMPTCDGCLLISRCGLPLYLYRKPAGGALDAPACRIAWL
jgi:hypothetical protein